MRQWVLSFPYPLRSLFASCPAIMGQLLGIVALQCSGPGQEGWVFLQDGANRGGHLDPAVDLDQ
jgi:hypothetical protein